MMAGVSVRPSVRPSASCLDLMSTEMSTMKPKVGKNHIHVYVMSAYTANSECNIIFSFRKSL